MANDKEKKKISKALKILKKAYKYKYSSYDMQQDIENIQGYVYDAIKVLGSKN